MKLQMQQEKVRRPHSTCPYISHWNSPLTGGSQAGLRRHAGHPHDRQLPGAAWLPTESSGPGCADISTAMESLKRLRPSRRSRQQWSDQYPHARISAVGQSGRDICTIILNGIVIPLIPLLNHDRKRVYFDFNVSQSHQLDCIIFAMVVCLPIENWLGYIINMREINRLKTSLPYVYQ